jgi:hypothetical protein
MPESGWYRHYWCLGRRIKQCKSKLCWKLNGTRCYFKISIYHFFYTCSVNSINNLCYVMYILPNLIFHWYLLQIGYDYHCHLTNWTTHSRISSIKNNIWSHFTSKQKSTKGIFFLFSHLSYQILLKIINCTYKL